MDFIKQCGVGALTGVVVSGRVGECGEGEVRERAAGPAQSEGGPGLQTQHLSASADWLTDWQPPSLW